MIIEDIDFEAIGKVLFENKESITQLNSPFYSRHRVVGYLVDNLHMSVPLASKVIEIIDHLGMFYVCPECGRQVTINQSSGCGWIIEDVKCECGWTWSQIV